MLSFPYWEDTFIKSERTQTVVTNKSDLFKKTVQINGMTCSACEATVQKVAMDIDGVISAKASTKNKNAVIEFDKTKTDIHSIMKAIATTGYKPVAYEDESATEKQGSKK